MEHPFKVGDRVRRFDLGHDKEIGAAFAEYDRLVRWEEHNSRLDAQDPVHERAAARGRIVALIANLATEIQGTALIRIEQLAKFNQSTYAPGGILELARAALAAVERGGTE